MASATLTFDRLAYIDRLKNSGVGDEQARARAAALEAALGDSVATKQTSRPSASNCEPRW